MASILDYLNQNSSQPVDINSLKDQYLKAIGQTSASSQMSTSVQSPQDLDMDALNKLHLAAGQLPPNQSVQPPLDPSTQMSIGQPADPSISTQLPPMDPVKALEQLKIPSKSEKQEVPTKDEDTQVIPDNTNKVINFGKGDIASVDKLRQLQNDANKNLNGIQMQKAGALIGNAIAGVKDDSAQKFFADQEKHVNDQVAQYNDQVAMQKQDPNSPYSQGLKDYIKKAYGYDLQGDVSAADLEKTVLKSAADDYEKTQQRDMQRELKQASLDQQKMIEESKSKDRALTRESLNSRVQDNRDAKQDIVTNARLDKLGKDLQSEVASGRSAFGIAAKNLQSIQNVDALLQGRDLNSLDPREVYETAKVLDRVLSQSGATMSGTEHLTPENAGTVLAKLKERLGNERVGANAGQFMENFEKTFAREKDNAQKQINKVQQERLSGYRDLKDNERFNDLVSTYGVNPDALTFNRDKGAAPASQTPVKNAAPDAKPQSVIQNGHTYTLDPDTGEYK